MGDEQQPQQPQQQQQQPQSQQKEPGPADLPVPESDAPKPAEDSLGQDLLDEILAANSSCLTCSHCIKMTAALKNLREFVLTMPVLNIYANIGFGVKSIQHESKFVTLGNGSKRPVAMLMLVCEPQHTEVLRSMAEIQEKYSETIYAEVKVTTTGKNGAIRLDVFSGRLDLAGQLRSNILDDDSMAPVALRVRLPHLISGDCEMAKASRVFNYLSNSVISDMVKKTFEDGE